MILSRAGSAASFHRFCHGSGEPILFLHGLPTSCHLWDGVIKRMCCRFTCIAIDLPGLGHTPRRPGGFRQLDTLAEEIEALRIDFGVDQWHIVGHDAGCAIGIEYAHHYPERVGRLALLTPSVFPDLRPFFLFELLRKPVVGEVMAPAINLLFWKMVIQLALEDGVRNKEERDEVVRDFCAPFQGLAGAWRLMSLLRWGTPAEVLGSMPERLSDLTAPTLIFHGTKDPAVPPAFAARAADLIPQSELILLDAGHFIPMTESEVVARELSRFFTASSRAFRLPVPVANMLRQTAVQERPQV